LIEQSLKEEPDWDRGAIERRREQIKEWAIHRWYVEPPVGGWEKENDLEKNLSKLSYEEKKEIYYQRYLDNSDKLGFGKEFRALLEVAKRFPLYLYLNPKYAAPSFNLLSHRTTWMIWIGPDLYVSVNNEEFDRVYHLPEGETSKIIGFKN